MYDGRQSVQIFLEVFEKGVKILKGISCTSIRESRIETKNYMTAEITDGDQWNNYIV